MNFLKDEETGLAVIVLAEGEASLTRKVRGRDTFRTIHVIGPDTTIHKVFNTAADNITQLMQQAAWEEELVADISSSAADAKTPQDTDLPGKNVDPYQYSHSNFRAKLLQVMRRRLALAERKNSTYKQTYAKFGFINLLQEVLKVAMRLYNMTEEAMLENDSLKILDDPKIFDQLQDLANYTDYAQFYFPEKFGEDK